MSKTKRVKTISKDVVENEVDNFEHFRSSVQNNGGDMKYRIKWSGVSGNLCSKKIPIGLKDKWYITYISVVRLTILFGLDCWVVNKKIEQKMNKTEMRMLKEKWLEKIRYIMKM